MPTLFNTLIVTAGLLSYASCPANAAELSPLRPWDSYRTIMWVGDSAAKRPDKLPLFYQRLREMGINTAMVFGDGDPQPLLDNQFPYYVENMVNRGLCLKFSSQVTDWDKFITEWARNGRLESAFVRDYCLDDPEWRRQSRRQVQRIATRNRANAPLAYNLRDELSVTISANPFDYDFSPVTLSGFRTWLRSQYHDLNALNAEWQTDFGSWEDVEPFSTDRIKNRMASGEALPRGNPDWREVAQLKFDPRSARDSPTRWNFSPWADFRTFMDISLADALDDLRSAAREVDPHTPVGIEGTQMPSAFGGYDLLRLSRVLDWVEPYDIGNAREIFGSFMLGKPILTTVGESDSDHARRRLWHLLLEGDRGCIVWWSEDCIDWGSEDYALTAKGRALAPVLREMTSTVARILMQAERESDPVYIHYSQPSIQVDWLLESTVDGSTWIRRFSSFEASHNRQLKVRNAWLKLFQDLGYTPRFVSSDELERLGSAGPAEGVLVLPQSLAMSDREVAALTRFQEGGAAFQTVLGDGLPGDFDEHGRLRATNALETLFAPVTSATAASVSWIEDPSPATDRPKLGHEVLPGDIATYGADRVRGEPLTDWPGRVRTHIRLPQSVTVPEKARVRIHRFRVSDARLIAFERNVNYQMSEDLKQAGGNELLEVPVELEAALAAPAFVYDLNAQRFLGHTNRLSFVLDPWRPTVLALLPERVPDDQLLSFLEPVEP